MADQSQNVTYVPQTETAGDMYRGLDVWPSQDILQAILAAQIKAVQAVAPALSSLADAADRIALNLRQGGRLIYAGAGSSGLLAHLDGLELPGTYGIPASQVVTLLAGGDDALFEIATGAEDDVAAAEAQAHALGFTSLDSVVAVSASGRTPFAVKVLEIAGRCGSLRVGMACNDATPVLALAEFPVLLATPPEVVAGSTRMNAGTAQKCALNMLSTLVAVRLGHVFDGLMINMRPENAKLLQRAVKIITKAVGVSEVQAQSALERAGGGLKHAILIAAGAKDSAAAQGILQNHDGNVRDALVSLGDGQGRAI
eukprot:gene12659-12752_t